MQFAHAYAPFFLLAPARLSSMDTPGARIVGFRPSVCTLALPTGFGFRITSCCDGKAEDVVEADEVEDEDLDVSTESTVSGVKREGLFENSPVNVTIDL